MKMKKVILYFMTLVVFSLQIKPAMAESVSIDNWNISFLGSAVEELNKENNNADLTDTYYYDGEYALVVKYPDYVEDARIVVTNEMSQSLSPGIYTMSFYARGSVDNEYTTAGIGENYQYEVNSDYWEIGSNTVGADTKKWKKYTRTIEYEGGDDKLCFIFRGYTNGWDIDEVSLTDVDGNEYVINGGFEEVSKSVVSEYDSQTYTPVNFVAIPFSGGLAVTWKNPSTPNLKSIELYDVTNEETVLLSNSFDKTPSAINKYKVLKLANGNVYRYKLCISYRDGNVIEYFTYGVPTANDTSYSPWSITISKDNEMGYSPMKFSVDSTEKYEGDVSLKLVSNSTGGSNVYAMFYRNIPVEVGADYCLRFWIKAENNKATFRISDNWKNLPGNASQNLGGVTGTYDWKEVVINIKETNSNSIRFFFLVDGACDAMWFDNLSLVMTKNANGELVEDGENLMSDGGFENHYKPSELGTVNALTAETGDEAIKLTWKSVSGASAIKLYQVMEEEYCLRGYLPVSSTSVDITNLASDRAHTFALACVDEYGNEGEMTEVTAYIEAPDFKVYESKLYSGKVEVDGVKAGTFKVETKVRNNKLDVPVPVTQMVALYKGNILKKLVSTSVMAEKLEADKLSTTIKSATIEIPEDDVEQYHIEVFIWNSKQDMKSLREFVSFGYVE